MRYKMRTLPTELKVNHISDFDIDDSQESLISLYCQLSMQSRTAD
jgi:hypothetical protein